MAHCIAAITHIFVLGCVVLIQIQGTVILFLNFVYDVININEYGYDCACTEV